ncbi:MAG: hypothetical protein H5T97_05070, partial [Firmicutes bacterium]|nr:hypothetical protein [Bacillota bacterium]
MSMYSGEGKVEAGVWRNLRTLAQAAAAHFLLLSLAAGILGVAVLAAGSSRTGEAARSLESGEPRDKVDSARDMMDGARVA